MGFILFLVTILTIIFILIVCVSFFQKQKEKRKKQEMEETLEALINFKNAVNDFRNVTGLTELDEAVKEMTISDFVEYGRFGYDATNPIMVEGIWGAKQYLIQLQTLDGKVIFSERECSVSASNLDMLVDKYRITTADGEFLTYLYAYMYSNETSEQVPEGFKRSLY